MAWRGSEARTRAHELEFFFSRTEAYSASLYPGRKTEIFSSVLPVSAWFTSYPMAWIWSWPVATNSSEYLGLVLSWWDPTASLYLGGGSGCESLPDWDGVDFDDDEEKRPMPWESGYEEEDEHEHEEEDEEMVVLALALALS